MAREKASGGCLRSLYIIIITTRTLARPAVNYSIINGRSEVQQWWPAMDFSSLPPGGPYYELARAASFIKRIPWGITGVNGDDTRVVIRRRMGIEHKSIASWEVGSSRSCVCRGAANRIQFFALHAKWP